MNGRIQVFVIVERGLLQWAFVAIYNFSCIQCIVCCPQPPVDNSVSAHQGLGFPQLECVESRSASFP